MKIGTVVSFASDPRERILALEREGVDSFWLHEIFTGYEAFSRAGYLAALTGRARIGVGVVNSYSRHPVITAMGASFLSNLTGGRVNLVVGVGGDAWVSGLLGYDQPKPLLRFREFLMTLKALLKGETVTHSSGSFRLNQVKLNPVPQHEIPILVACEHEGMMRIAAQLADGMCLEPSCCPIGYVKWAVETVRRAGSAKKPFSVVANLPIKVTDDPAGARASMKPMLAFHLSFPDEGSLYLQKSGYPESLASEIGEASGIPELIRQNRNPLEAFENGRIEKAAELVPDRFVDQCAVIGSAEACRARINELERLGVTHLIGSFQDVSINIKQLHSGNQSLVEEQVSPFGRE